jgi:hypothetical protein
MPPQAHRRQARSEQEHRGRLWHRVGEIAAEHLGASEPNSVGHDTKVDT